MKPLYSLTEKTSDRSEHPVAGSIEHYNGDRSVDATGHMDDGNWIDGHQYTLHMDKDATSMNIYTYGVPTPVSEEGIQWTITGYGHTILKGTIDTSEPANYISSFN